MTRLFGIASTAGAVFYWMLARHGIRDIFLSGKFWRPLVLGISFSMIFMGGFRSSIIEALIVFGLVFYLEKMHRTGMMLVVVLVGMMGGVLLVPLASHLPYTFQRSLAWLPLKIDPEARMDAEHSTQWRLDIWESLLPEVPKYLFLGKGYAFSAETFNESMGNNATFQKVIDPSQNPLALSSDFHSGPLSVVITFGIWGVLVWLWYWAAGFRVVWRNYHYGDPALRHLNLMLFALFVSKVFGFLFIFGGIVEDVAGFAGIIGLSLALNHGVAVRSRRPKSARSPPTRVWPCRSGLPSSGNQRHGIEGFSVKPKLLILELWGLGDLVIATPFIRAATEKFEVTLLAKPFAQEMRPRLWPAVKVVPFTAPWTAFPSQIPFLALAVERNAAPAP